MRIRLTVVRGKTDKKSVQLLLPAVIGRSREADLTIVHPMISRRHCELSEDGGLVRVRDLGALNGTFLGDRQVQEEIVRPGDLLTIGPMTFQVEYEPKLSSDSTDKCHVGPLSEEQLSDMVVGSGIASHRSSEQRHYDLETEPQPAAATVSEPQAEPETPEPASEPPAVEPALELENDAELSEIAESTSDEEATDDAPFPSIAPEPEEA
ncbi:MAG: FHA domain-containing protein, partial [Planctomycetota bacterium]